MAKPNNVSNTSDNFINLISDEFFVQIVENKLQRKRNEFTVKLVLLTPAVGKNENYSSILYRARIKVAFNTGESEDETIQCIVKVLLDFIPEELKFVNIFYRERRIYENMIPALEAIWQNVGESVQFAPKGILFETKPFEIIVLDDLQKNEFVLNDRKIGLGLDHSKFVLSKLAKFHAASALKLEKEGMVDNELNRKLSFPPVEAIKDTAMVKSMIQIMTSFCEHVSSWSGYDHYKEIFNRWDLMKALGSINDVANPMKSGFAVLNHGDLWNSNIMFKYDANKKLQDALFIDFQNSFWGSPACDLMYFFVSSVRDTIKVQCFDELISHYQSELVKGLTKIGYSGAVPTLDEIHADILEKGAVAVVSMMCILFIAKFDCTDDLSIDAIMKSENVDEIVEQIYKSKFYVKAVKVLLPFFKSRGFLATLNKDEKQ